MFIAKVTGSVVATRKEESLVGYKLMVIERINTKEEQVGLQYVAVDYVGAGIGETVLVGQGSSVRVNDTKKLSAIDMAIIGIIDTIT